MAGHCRVLADPELTDRLTRELPDEDHGEADEPSRHPKDTDG